MRQLTLGDPDATSVTFANAHDAFGDGDFVDVVVELGGRGLAARTVVRTYERGGDRLTTFVQTLSDDWKGWDGTRVWEAIEHDMKIEALSKPIGHVAMRFTLRENYQANAWTASVELVLEAGEEMSNFARELKDVIEPES